MGIAAISSVQDLENNITNATTNMSPSLSSFPFFGPVGLPTNATSMLSLRPSLRATLPPTHTIPVTSFPTKNPTNVPTTMPAETLTVSSIVIPVASNKPTRVGVNIVNNNQFSSFDNNGCFQLECMRKQYLKNTEDRLGYDAPMFKGQALCNSDEERFPGIVFQFGMTQLGSLVWQKCSTEDEVDTDIVVIYDHKSTPLLSSLPSRDVWFQMTSDATWQILAN